jgi:hypothetical protein
MKRFVPAFLFLAFLLSGCSSGPRMTLQQIQQKRVFHLTRGQVFETVRFFCVKEAFRIDSFDEESGRIIGHRTYQSGPSSDIGKMVIMNLRVIPVEPEISEVTSRFSFSSVNDALSREEEEILLVCYTTLYDHLEQKAK